MTHICVGNLTIIGSDNGLSPERRQAITWTNTGILLIGPLGRNFSDILIEIQTFLLKEIHLKMSSAKCCSFRFGLNVLKMYLPSDTFILNHVCSIAHSIVRNLCRWFGSAIIWILLYYSSCWILRNIYPYFSRKPRQKSNYHITRDVGLRDVVKWGLYLTRTVTAQNRPCA